MSKPVGLIATLPDSTGEQRQQWGAKLQSGGLLVRSISGILSGGAATENSQRIAPSSFGPEPIDVVRSLRHDLVHEITGAFGISPALFASQR